VLDLPGIIEGAKDGKGRGRQVIGTARTCNVICIVLDATRCVAAAVPRCPGGCVQPNVLVVRCRPLTHKKLIEYELEGFGIRLNKQPPNIVFRRKEKGGIAYRSSRT
jgi:ribosome-interacting GTPase 1